MAVLLQQSEIFAAQRTPTLVHFEFNANDINKSAQAGTNVEFTLPIKGGTFVKEVAYILGEVFNDSGTCTFMVYDVAAGGSNDWIPSTSVKASASVLPVTSRTVSGGDYATGKYYAADTVLTFRLVPQNANSTTGVIKGFVELSNVTLDGMKKAVTVAGEAAE